MTEPKKAGRPPHAPTEALRRQVEMMTAFGNTAAEICAIIGISEPTLRLHYRDEIDQGQVKATNAVALNLFRQATKDDPKAVEAAKFYLKCRAGWSEHAPMSKFNTLGKKELQDIAGQTLGEGSGWGDLLH